MKVEGVITTVHRNPSCIAKAIRIDNLATMKTCANETRVITSVTGTKLRSVIASADDYLMNLSIAEEACRYRKEAPRKENGQRQTKGKKKLVGKKRKVR